MLGNKLPRRQSSPIRTCSTDLAPTCKLTWLWAPVYFLSHFRTSGFGGSGRKWVGCKIEHGNQRSASGLAPRTVKPSMLPLSSVAATSNQRPSRCGSLEVGTYARIHSSFGASAIGRGSGHCGAGRLFGLPDPNARNTDSASAFCADRSHFTQKFDTPRYSAADPSKISD